MIIDAHTHIFSPELVTRREELCHEERRFGECYLSPKARMASVEELIQSMDQSGVDKTVVTGFAFKDSALCAISNDYIIDAVRSYPDRLIGLGAVQPHAGDKALYEAERCMVAGLAGLGELTADGQEFDITDPELFKDLALLVQKQNGVLMVHASEPVGHLYPGKGQTTPDKVIKLAQNFPELNIIAAHWGGGLPFYELMPEVAASLSNLYYDTAATTYLYRFGVFRAVCDMAGVRKILWASDWPLLGQARLLERVRNEALLDEQELQMVLGENSARLFGLTENRV
jgi:predicted TIM-barrel fold metal-dependent hydrolase